GRGEPPPTGVVAPQQLRWHLAGDQEAARRGRAGELTRTLLAAEVNRRRRELLRRNNLDGTLQEIKKLLDEAVLA
ncbi:hypothetical protein GR254_25010, partial [Mycobacterium tuberculosis]|nr:hypothetical protein [Mycobacterium tuberculosis]